MFTHFSIPIRKDNAGGVEIKQIVVSDHMLPVMADIIEAATHPSWLSAHYDLRTHGRPFTEDMLKSIRDRVRYDLEHNIREQAKKAKLAVITEVTITELPDMGGMQFRAEAAAMPLLMIRHSR